MSIYERPRPGESCCWCEEPATVFGTTDDVLFEPTCEEHRHYLSTCDVVELMPKAA